MRLSASGTWVLLCYIFVFLVRVGLVPGSVAAALAKTAELMELSRK